MTICFTDRKLKTVVQKGEKKHWFENSMVVDAYNQTGRKTTVQVLPEQLSKIQTQNKKGLAMWLSGKVLPGSTSSTTKNNDNKKLKHNQPTKIK